MGEAPFQFDLPQSLQAVHLHALCWSSGLNAHHCLEAEFDLAGDQAQAFQLIGQSVTWRLKRPDALKDLAFTAQVERVTVNPITLPKDCPPRSRVRLHAHGASAAFDVVPRIEFHGGEAQAQPVSQVLKAFLNRFPVKDTAPLNLTVNLLTQAQETDFAFLCRVAGWHGLVVASAMDGALRLLHGAKSQETVAIEPAWILEQEILCGAKGPLKADVFTWDIPGAQATHPKSVSLAPKIKAAGDAAKQSPTSAPAAHFTWPGQHHSATAEQISKSHLATQLGEGFRWHGTLRPTSDKLLKADFIKVPGVGDLLVLKRTLRYPDGIEGYVIEIEAIDPAALPPLPPTPGPLWVPGQVCNLNDPQKSGRIKVNLPGMKRDGNPRGWTGIWCPFVGAGGVDGQRKAHGPWSPPRELAWVAVWIDPAATAEPLVLGAISHSNCTAQALGVESTGPWVLFQEGELKLRADTAKNTWELSAGKNRLILAADPAQGFTGEWSKLVIKTEQEARLESKEKIVVKADKVVGEGAVEISGTLNVKK